MLLLLMFSSFLSYLPGQNGTDLKHPPAALQLYQGISLCSKLPTQSFLVVFLLTRCQVQNDGVSVLADNQNKIWLL